MAIDTVTKLVDALRASKLLEPEQLGALDGEAEARYGEPTALARELIQRGWLTLFQAKQLLHGNGPDLVVGPYKILERIGEGGMGQVYKALHTRMGRTDALKVVKPELVAEERAVRRFLREARAAGQLDHPNIVRVYNAEKVGR